MQARKGRVMQEDQEEMHAKKLPISHKMNKIFFVSHLHIYCVYEKLIWMDYPSKYMKERK